MNVTPSKPLKLILASQSPRRKALLQNAGFYFEVIPSQVDENITAKVTPEDLAGQLARAKAEDLSKQHCDAVVLGADTIVVLGDAILGKPTDKDDARRMLQKLSGVWHQVMTGYAIIHGTSAKTVSDVIVTDVKFKRLTAAEIEWYIETTEPDDKAGAYAIQGIGALWVEEIKGSYPNVVGLPVCEVSQALFQMGIQHPANTFTLSNRI